MSQRKAPNKVAKFVLPLKMLMIFVAVIFFRLNTVVRYTKRLARAPMAPSFSKVSFPACYSVELLKVDEEK